MTMIIRWIDMKVRTLSVLVIYDKKKRNNMYMGL